jgi:hypothetical protein
MNGLDNESLYTEVDTKSVTEFKETRALPCGQAGGQIKGCPFTDHPLDDERVCLTGILYYY